LAPSAGSRAATPNAPRPRWIAARRQLWLAETLVKQFQKTPRVVGLVLAAFEEEGWPEWIDDPLRPIPGRREKRRLRNAVHNLNRRLDVPLLHFHTRGGKRIGWRLVATRNG
jgi:hypothetical protein